ncbi:MAG: hypothetical protein K2G36_12050 [Ruminococcus sp.]|nr:hypothetical protein [Ruminococcus sp.]
MELNTLEIADFVLNFSRVYCEFYTGGWCETHNNNGGITIDISDNPFKDGWYCYREHENHDKDCKCVYEIVNAMYGEIIRISNYFRPFKLKYHGRKHFGLGQKIRLPDGRSSVVTSIKWQFRNGTNLTCAGKDNRLLSVSAKRSQAAKVKDLAYTKINRLQQQINDIQENISRGGE